MSKTNKIRVKTNKIRVKTNKNNPNNPNKSNKSNNSNKSPKEVKGTKSVKKIKILKKRGKTKKEIKHGKSYVNIDNIGSTKIMYTEGNQPPKKTLLEWDGHYDGKNANIHMNLDVDGKKRQTELKLTNDELMKILGANVVNRPIDERLESLDEDVGKMYSLNESSPMMMMALQQRPLYQMPLQQPLSPYQQMPLQPLSPYQQMPLQPLSSYQQMPLSQYQQMPLPNVPVFIDEMPEDMRR